MTDIKAVYPDYQRQVVFPFVGPIEQERRVVKRREIDMTEVDIVIGLLIGDDEPFIEYFLSCFGHI